MPTFKRLTNSWVVVFCCMVLLLSACSTEAVQEESSNGALSDFLGLDPDEAETSAQFDRLVQACMKAAGFEYQTPPSSAGVAGLGAEADGLSPEEFAAEFGYGIFTTFAFGPAGEAGSIEDPNASAVAQMSDSERAAWNLALRGIENFSDLPHDANGVIDLSAVVPDGCLGDAIFAISDSQQLLVSALNSDLQDLERRYQADERIVTLSSDWVSCMAARGFEFLSPTGPAELFLDELTNFQRPPTVQELETGSADLTDDEVVQFNELLEDEIATATADWSCTAPHADEIRVIRDRYEAEFVAEHADTLAG